MPSEIQERVDELQRLRTETAKLRESSADDIREEGWVVAIHNDYRLKGIAHTFWLFTKGDRNLKGEGLTDAAALTQVRQQLFVACKAA